MSTITEIVRVCKRYLSGEMNNKAFESGFDSLVLGSEEELAKLDSFRHIEAIRHALELFEPVEAVRATDDSLIDEAELRRLVASSVRALDCSPAILAHDQALTTQLNDQCTRRVLVYGEALMLVEFTFQKGGIGAMHKHEQHDQVGYVVKGSLELTVGEEKRVVRAGDSYYAARNVLHGVVALEDDTVIMDAFTPKREDFLG